MHSNHVTNHVRQRQLAALIRRYLLLKRRRLLLTFVETAIPVVLYLILFFQRGSLKAAEDNVQLPTNTTVKYQEVEVHFNDTYKRPGPVLVIINTKNASLRNESFKYFQHVLGSSGIVELVSMSNNSERARESMNARYLFYRTKAVDEVSKPVGVVVNLDREITKKQAQASSMMDLNLMDNLIGIYTYKIVLAGSGLSNLGHFFQFYDTAHDSCLPDDFSFPITNVDPSKLSVSKCPAIFYARAQFLHLQNAAQRTILKFTETCDSRKYGVAACAIDMTNSMTNSIKWQMMPRAMPSGNNSTVTTDTDSDIAAPSLTAYLIGFSLIPMVSGAVYDKEKGLVETMGMNCLTWKLSLFIVYFAEIVIVSALSTIVTWKQRIAVSSGAGMFFILLLSYGFALIAFALLLIRAFNTSRTATPTTIFIVGILGLPYKLIDFFFKFFSNTSMPTFGYYLLSLLYPFAYQTGITELRNYESGIVSSVPEVTAWRMILMLLLDGCIYLLIGLICDFLPGNSHCRRTAACSNGCNEDSTPQNVEVDASLDQKKAIVISNLTKSFRRTARQTINAIDNLSLTVYSGQITCLLGPNGAGKTTLIRILSGSLKDYSGSVNFEQSCQNVEVLRRDIGICSQENMLFDDMTVAEHLNFVLEMKSDLSEKARRMAVAETIAQFSLTEHATTYGVKLSHAEKRKLCLAMAIISKPKILFLDEPTAGLDVNGRRHIWDILMQYKQADHVVLLSTHYMDEADILADRKVLMHRGRIHSAGSSMFLRQRFGCGYRLTVELDANADLPKASAITCALQTVMPSIVPIENERSRSELSYALHTEEGNVDELLSLMLFLEYEQAKLARLGVLNYGWTTATFDEVFMKFEEEVAGQENEDLEPRSSLANRISPVQSKIITTGYPKRKPADVNNIADHPEDLPQTLSFQGIEAPEGSANSMGRHYVAVLYLRLITSLRNRVFLMMRLFFPIIIAILGLTMARVLISRVLPILQKMSDSSSINETAIYAYQPFIYTNVSSSMKKYMAEQFEGDDEQNEIINKVNTYNENNGPFLLILNSSNTIRAEAASQNIQLMSSTLMKTIEANASARLQDFIATDGSIVGISFDINDFGEIIGDKLIFNPTAIHALPALFAYAHSMEVLTATSAQDNTYLPIFLPLLSSFTSASRAQVIQVFISNFIFTSLFAIHVLAVLPSIGCDVARDRESGCAKQIKLAGISNVSYWLGSLTVDAVGYAVFWLFFLLLAYLFGVHSFKFTGAYYAFLLLILLVVPANVLMIYCLSLCFKSYRIFSSVVTLLVAWTGFFPFTVVFYCSMSTVVPNDGKLALNSEWQTLRTVFSFLFPSFNAAAGVFLVAFASQPNIATLELPSPDTADYFSDKGLTYLYVGSAIQIVVFSIFILILETWQELWQKLKSAIPWPNYLYTKRGQSSTTRASEFSLQCDEDEAEDVAKERREVAELEQSVIGSSSTPYVSQVYKVYTKFCRDCKPAEPKCAVKDVSFKLNCGQFFGLLGPNGAGKTTLIKIIAGSESPTSGNICSSGSTSLGYCPQDNVLWEHLSAQEHFFIYSFVRGFSAIQRKEITMRLADGLGISSHLKKQTKRMSNGTKRKLRVALCLLGRPSVFCLDDPSAGMDLGSKRFLWRFIRQIFTNPDRNVAALLTTHQIKEAEALCDRIGIIINGELKCIGSRRHLKTKYGRYYTLEVKLGEKNVPALEKAQLIEYINALLSEDSSNNDKEAPQLINSFGRYFIFRIPSCRVRSLANIFSELDSQKQTGRFASYSFSQVSLEQILIQFASKDQYEA